MKLYEFFSVPSVQDSENTVDTKSDQQKLANDIFWFILDHDRLHKKHFMPIAQDIFRDLKSKKGIDRTKYTECWLPMVKEGCMEFYEKNKVIGDPKKIFSKEFCKSLCEKLAEHNIEHIRKGEFKLGF